MNQNSAQPNRYSRDLDPLAANYVPLTPLSLLERTVAKKIPEATRKAFQNGWYHTGDLGVRHPDGYLEIKDRVKDVIMSGGESVSSLEVEQVLRHHPDIVEAAVVARPDQHWVETVCAFVTLKPEAANLTAEDIMAWCRQYLAYFKIPRTVVFGDLPKTSGGQVQKFVLRERAKTL